MTRAHSMTPRSPATAQPSLTPMSPAAARGPAAIALAILILAALAAVIAFALLSQRTRTVFEADSEFGRVRVTERADGLRSLYTGDGRARQSAIYPGRPMHLEHAYTRVAAIGLALTPPDGRLLFVGLGGGAMPMFAREVLPAAHIDVVEIDPIIVRVAQDWFGFETGERMVVHTGDGRAFIEAAPPGTYDLIVLDAFSDDEVPYSLTTRQFLEAVRSRLNGTGVVASNLWTAQSDYAAMVATYAEVFDQVHLLDVPGRSQRILLAARSDRPLDRDALVEAARTLASDVDLGFDLAGLVEAGYRRAPDRNGRILEDR